MSDQFATSPEILISNLALSHIVEIMVIDDAFERFFLSLWFSTFYPHTYQQKTKGFPQKKTIDFLVHMLKCTYINSYSNKSSTCLKYTSDFGQYLPKEFQFDEFHTKWRECL